MCASKALKPTAKPGFLGTPRAPRFRCLLDQQQREQEPSVPGLQEPVPLDDTGFSSDLSAGHFPQEQTELVLTVP